jgi:hypothetical protein
MNAAALAGPTPATTPLDKAALLIRVVAALQLFGSLTSVSILFGDMSDIPGPGWGGWAVTAEIALVPVFAILALVLSLRGRLGAAILSLAAIVMLGWLSTLPSHINHWAEFPGQGFYGLVAALEFGAYPLLVLAFAGLVWRGERLGVAAVLVSIPTLIHILGFAAFATGVAIYGF